MSPTSDSRENVIVVRCERGAVSFEFMPIGENVSRGFLRFSPRNLTLPEQSASELSSAMVRRGFNKIIVGDNKKGVLKRALRPNGWSVERAIPLGTDRRSSAATAFDMPLESHLVDLTGTQLDASGAGQLNGIRVDLGGRKGWAFYGEEGSVARVISEPERRQGFLAAESPDDMFEVADALVRHLANRRKEVAVFSVDYGRFIRKFNPVEMWRMVLDRPVGYDHSVKPVGSSNKRMAAKLFSEYYDESLVQAILRLRKFRADSSYATFAVDGGFAVTRLEGDSGLIYDIYVTPAKQGEGIGEELMRCALTSLVGRVSSVYLHTSYPRAKRMYEKFGFKTSHTQLGVWLYESVLTPPTAR